MHQTATVPPDAATSRKKKSRRRRFIIFGIIGLLVLWVVGSYIASKREKPIPVTTEKAAKRNIVQLVTATGKVQPETEVKISPEVAGEIIDLPVEDGSKVKKGDLLVKIKPDSYKAVLDQQEAGISAARATTLQQKATMVKTSQDLQRAEDMYAKKTISVQEYNAAQAAYDVAKNTYDSSLHQIEMAEASSSQARDALSKTTIYSPIDGTVTVLNSKLGERVVATNQFAGTEVMRVADLRRMQAVVDVNENDVVTVKTGDTATVTIDAYTERKFKGKVALIAHTGTTTGTGTQEEVTNFQVKIDLDTDGVLLRPGLSCTAEIQTAQADNVVTVPLQSVTIRTGDSTLSPEEIEKQREQAAARDKSDNDAEVTNTTVEKREKREERERMQKVVFLKAGNKVKQVRVTTGIANDTYVEVKSGVSPGDEVVSGSYTAISRKLKDGARIEYEKPAKK